MKKILKFTVLLLLTLNSGLLALQAQTPQQFKYQAVLRDASGNIMADENVNVNIKILKTSATGTEVFSENHNGLTTTAQGLININIGDTEDLSVVNWSADSYFIKITVNGVEMGTSQMLSVPYALLAKTAENVISYMAGDGIDITNNIISEKKYQIGDFVYGGVIFWLDDTGEHGLVCAIEDVDGGSGVKWDTGTHINTFAKSFGISGGVLNTAIIIAATGDGGDVTKQYAARLCSEYSYQDSETLIYYGGWYLPSIMELYYMYDNKEIIDATAVAHGGSTFSSSNPTSYWSSTEDDISHAQAKRFDMNGSSSNGKNYLGRVRPVRAF